LFSLDLRPTFSSNDINLRQIRDSGKFSIIPLELAATFLAGPRGVHIAGWAAKVSNARVAFREQAPVAYFPPSAMN
jgi:hypothetical protein